MSLPEMPVGAFGSIVVQRVHMHSCEMVGVHILPGRTNTCVCKHWEEPGDPFPLLKSSKYPPKGLHGGASFLGMPLAYCCPIN